MSLRSEEEGAADISARALPYRLLLAMLMQLQWSMLSDAKSASKNPTLAFTLMRRIPDNLVSLPKHLPTSSIPARCVLALTEVMDWFLKDCNDILETEDDVSFDCQLESLRKVASRMPHLGSSMKEYQPRPFCYDETESSLFFLMPVIWRCVHMLMPAHVCWHKDSL